MQNIITLRRLLTIAIVCATAYGIARLFIGAIEMAHAIS